MSNDVQIPMVDRVRSLERSEAQVLHGRCQDLPHGQIAAKYGKTADTWSRNLMTSVFEKLGAKKADSRNKKREFLKTQVCPVLDEILEGNEANLGKWPLYGWVVVSRVGDQVVYREREEFERFNPDAQKDVSEAEDANLLSDDWREEVEFEASELDKEEDAEEQKDEPSEDTSSQTVSQSADDTSTSKTDTEQSRDFELRPPQDPPLNRLLLIVPVLICAFCLVVVWMVRDRFLAPPDTTPTSLVTDQGATDTFISTETTVPSTPSFVLPLTETPTNTPTPTETTEPTITPTQPPTQTPRPTLFHDPFDTGIRPEWGMVGDNFNSVDGKLSSLGTLHGVIGDATWTNYAVEFNIDHYHWSYIEAGLRILVRYQDDGNYMALAIKSVNGCDFRWLLVTGGSERVVNGTETHVSQDYRQCLGLWRIEVDGDRYKVIINFEPKREFFEATFNSGGVGIFVNQDTTELILDEFKVFPVP